MPQNKILLIGYSPEEVAQIRQNNSGTDNEILTANTEDELLTIMIARQNGETIREIRASNTCTAEMAEAIRILDIGTEVTGLWWQN